MKKENNMKQGFYIHKKTGRLYFMLTDNFMFKDEVGTKHIVCGDDDFDNKHQKVYDWRGGLILYKSEYDRPDGNIYFARTPEDFYANFEKAEDE